MAPADLVAAPIVRLPGILLWDSEAVEHIAPAESVSDDEGDRPMSYTTTAVPSVPANEVAAVKRDAPIVGASYILVPLVATAVIPPASAPPVTSPLSCVVPAQDRASSFTPAVAPPEVLLYAAVAPVARVPVVRTLVTAIAEMNALSVNLGPLANA